MPGHVVNSSRQLREIDESEVWQCLCYETVTVEITIFLKEMIKICHGYEASKKGSFLKGSTEQCLQSRPVFRDPDSAIVLSIRTPTRPRWQALIGPRGSAAQGACQISLALGDSIIAPTTRTAQRRIPSRPYIHSQHVRRMYGTCTIYTLSSSN
jgi:hypothetical protein